jgi:hypothetical protein
VRLSGVFGVSKLVVVGCCSCKGKELLKCSEAEACLQAIGRLAKCSVLAKAIGSDTDEIEFDDYRLADNLT